MAGTKALTARLRQSNDIALSENEIHWFDRYADQDITGYFKYLPSRSHAGQKIGDCTTNYALLPDTAGNIHQHFPEAKILFVIRNPVYRTLTHYTQLLNDNKIKGDMNFSMKVEQALLDVPKHPPVSGNLLSRGFYLDQLQRYEATFGRENMHILCGEQVVNKSYDLSAAFAFLEVQPSAQISTGMGAVDPTVLATEVNTEVSQDKLPLKTKWKLLSYYLPVNEKLVQWLKNGPDAGSSEYSQNLIKCVRDWKYI